MAEHSSFNLWIFRSLRRIMRAVDIHSRQLSAEFMITGPQLLCLQTLHDDGPLTTSALAKLIHLSNSTTVGILDRLEHKGWILRERSTTDRRYVLVHITGTGETFLAGAPSLLQDRLASGLQALPEKDQLAIAQALEHIVEMLEMSQQDVAPLLEAGPIIDTQSDGEADDLAVEHGEGNMSSTNRALSSAEPRTVADLPEGIADRPALQHLADVPIPEAAKDPVVADELVHRDFDDTPFWQRIPAFADVDRATFMDTGFQLRHCVSGAADLRELAGPLVDTAFLDDVEQGLAEAPMNVRVTPYLLSLIDWDNPYDDPIRIQFLPVASTRLPDHPRLALDSLHEQEDSPTPGLVHRYPDKALFLPLDVCPVYCRFCTRSYAVGGSTDTVDKDGYKPQQRPLAGGLRLPGGPPRDRGRGGLRRRRLPAAPAAPEGDPDGAAGHPPHPPRAHRHQGAGGHAHEDPDGHQVDRHPLRLVDEGRKRTKEVCLHTHFNCTNEITAISREAMDLLFRRGVQVRNQSVLIRGVNDDPEQMANLVKQLSYMNVQPYYVYQHDMVKGVEELRTRLEDSMEIERAVRGVTAGFNTPTFVTDVPGGGGKRDLHSFDFYDETTGVSVYRSPAVDPDKAYLYFDPIDLLPAEGRARWAKPSEHARIVKEALLAAGLAGKRAATA